MATIVMPLSLITGLWGMNVPVRVGNRLLLMYLHNLMVRSYLYLQVPGQDGETAPVLSWFFGICIALGAITVVALMIFKYLKWV